MKRFLALLMTVIMLTAMFTACSKSSETKDEGASKEETQAPAASTQEEEAKKEPITLSFATYQQWNNNGLRAMLESYEKATGNKIDFQLYPDDQFKNLIKTKLATGDAPDLFADNALTDLVSADKCEPLEGPWIQKIRSADLVEQITRKSDNKIICAPYGASTAVGVIYNKNVMKEAGVELPLTTYDALMNACEKIKAIGVTPVYFAGKDSWTMTFWMYYSWGHVFDRDPSIAEKILKHEIGFADVPGIIEMQMRYLNFRDKGYINDNWKSATYMMALEAVGKGEAAMFASGEWHLGEVKESFPELLPNMGMMPATLDDEIIDVYVAPSQSGMYVYNGSKHVQEAKEFINFVMSDEILKKYYDEMPAMCPLKIDTKSNEWAEEMVYYSDEFGLPMKRSFLTNYLPGMKYGEIENIYGIRTMTECKDENDIKKLLEEFDESLIPLNKAAGLEGW
ncbi:MAG TPA: carbohydrate ABC transporter substrate-binding protein [Clostridiaceae bacterium]|nr:carbohydrate ABC transporter substrate-binding protein [Clostridiaceae bacterium]